MNTATVKGGYYARAFIVMPLLVLFKNPGRAVQLLLHT